MMKLFEKSIIKGMKLKNRLIRSATDEGMADENGFPTEKLFRLYRRLAKGGISLLITGFTFVAKDGRPIFPGTLGIDSDEHIPVYRDLVRMVHENGTKIAMQIAHSGRQTPVERIGTTPIAPSVVTDKSINTTPREMTVADIDRIIDAFAHAARRAKESGFDAVQIHCAHGYLLSSFLSPHTNRRTDGWGGSLENRMRIVREVYNRCRRSVGDDYPLLVKYNGWDNMENGTTPEEGVRIGEMLAEMGFDGIEVSCGIGEDGGSVLMGKRTLGEEPEQGYNRHVSAQLAKSIKTPIFLVGGLTDPAVMEEILNSGDADYISLCRSLIAEPDFPEKIAEDCTHKTPCVYCNLCIMCLTEGPLRCYRGKEPGKENLNGENADV